MGLSKTSAFNAQQNQLSVWMHALGHPARIAILEELASMKSCVCGELVDVLPLAQATVSQHLKVLKKAGLIRGEISGPKTCYCIDFQQWQLARSTVLTFFDTAIRQADESCC